MKESKVRHLAVDCDRCEATVRAEVRGEHTTTYFELSLMMSLPNERISLVLCPSCDQVLLARETWKGEDKEGFEVWSNAVRLWPKPEREASSIIPQIVRVSLEEARRCYRAAAYTATAMMCGRALEGVCVHFETRNRTLARGLEELLEKGIIDARLALWGEQLRKHRNLAAHATEEKTSREDATDLLDFVDAICEYVFVLTPKFRSFMARKESEASAEVAKEETAVSSAEP